MLRDRHLLFGLAVTLVCCGVTLAQYSSNMFLNGEYQNGIKANPSKSQAINPTSNLFLEHAIISRQASPFQGPTYLPPEEVLKCSAGKQCVLKGQCTEDGYFANPALKAQNCRPSTHTCCIYRPPPPPPPTTTERPYDICSKDYDCVPSRFCNNGEIDSADYIQKGKSDRCYSPDICCRIPSTTLTDDGYVLRTPEVKFTIPTTGRPYQPPSIPQQPTPPRQPPSIPQQPTPPRQPPSPPRQQPSPPRQPPSPSPPAPAPPRLPPTTPQREYLPPNTYPTTSKPVTPRYEYIPPAPTTPSRQVFTQTPYQPAVTPSRPTFRPQPVPTPQNAYLPPSPALPPPSDYHVLQPSNTVTQTITVSPPRIPKPTSPQRGEDILSLPLDNRQHLSKCASALECTPENFCNSIGVITDQPVDVNSAESAFRVPLTDCFLENGAPGKCCRDANYVDPWPINLAGVCATRNKNTKPQGIQDVDANFGEIPWQAMILKESTKTLLGGGAIIGDQIVLTTASVVKGVSPNDLKVKGGEWELGRDSEPLPFQIVGVKSIDIHPEYNPSTGSNDMAVLRLDKRIEFAQHVKPICVTNEDPKPEEKCITTGWGKQAIKIHEEGAVLHVSNTITQSRADCGADETSVCSSVVHDPCLLDVGSALACGSGSSVMLKGIYAAENACGDGQTVRFSKPDLKWVNGFFTIQNKDILLKKRRV
ncbi:PREDICTED: serine proteinase stubble isoform X2 [Rhagoletis zephyria]|uniref:serine proteinase stubble isoform X2 n=1 Tax=Rhagoletis zephyria TaxID=28612 RepID=UPI000811490C|nr:PREDICTED: serine proteinase stubble isoform X2 [Rhagoletis zephyria]